ncbi:hypothetical protein FTO74_09800 [Granulicella sp. WH15]|uniref:hypothetical protein n=1 Tax=Granulicella sp. WH15 TaxID=2602070 RepID=UPI001366B3D6|nr:hypothetical protein [Granulicella sp. WH15]QHN03628.1 hypothetical protein FTO74_09800 [Granulicella sp. WH15]
MLGLTDECVDAFSKAVTVIEANSGGNLWELARVVRETLLPFETAEGNAPIITAISEAMAGNMNVVEALAFSYAAFSEQLMIFNLSTVPLAPGFGSFTIKSLWAPVFLRGHAHEQTVGVTSIDDSIRLVHTSWIPIPDLLERTERKLEEACVPIPIEA